MLVLWYEQQRIGPQDLNRDYQALRGPRCCARVPSGDPLAERSNLPLLREQFSPNVDRAIARLAEQASKVSELLTELARPILEQSVRIQCVGDGGAASVTINTKAIASVPSIVAAEVCRQAWRQARWPTQSMTRDKWLAIVELASQGGGTNLPGNVDARVTGELIVLTRR